MPHWNWWYWDGGAFLGFPMFPLLFIALCFLVMVFVMSMMMRGRGNVRSNALDILDERLARGEIGLAEYEERRRLISG